MREVVAPHHARDVRKRDCADAVLRSGAPPIRVGEPPKRREIVLARPPKGSKAVGEIELRVAPLAGDALPVEIGERGRRFPKKAGDPDPVPVPLEIGKVPDVFEKRKSIFRRFPAKIRSERLRAAIEKVGHSGELREERVDFRHRASASIVAHREKRFHRGFSRSASAEEGRRPARVYDTGMRRILGVAAILAARLLAAGAPPIVPVAEEPMHHRKLENEYVRVFDVTVPPHGQTLFHAHALDYVFVTLGSSHVRSERWQGPSVELTLADGETRFTAAPLTHRAVNLADAPFRNITVEIVKRGGSPPEPPLPPMPGHSVVFENDRVRIDRQILEPGESTGVHRHTLRSLGICVSPARVEYSEEGKTETADLAAGDFSWHDAPRTHSLKNVGATRFEAVEIEWK